MLKEANKEIISEALKSEKTKLVVFYADWCGPCRMYKGSLEQLDSNDNVEILRVNIDHNREFALENGVQGIPYTKVFTGDKQVKDFSGYVPYEILKEQIAPYIK
ncbi:thioredoxin family protein [Mycoplasma sp. CSL7503-lung]|uniref:thioredoxin family protein n=1 Tax=Mycoplasma sp. CSL7503-lung TaxID=536372 RepID=UPI0021CEAFDA|nr:thioredoxin family protein [Mycoplasma sp. CSL7503-lung]MCU4706784.1 thioredoxin family protein [Mycoplasma sp. CSL7503-lung]